MRRRETGKTVSRPRVWKLHCFVLERLCFQERCWPCFEKRFESGVGGNQVLPVGKDPRQLYRALRVDPELSKGVFSLGEQLGRRKVWHKSRQGASVFLADRAAGAEEEAGSINGGKAEGEVILVDS